MGLRFIPLGDIFDSDAQVLVCPTNAGGIMGAGLAKTFRDRVPNLYYRYKKHCNAHRPEDLVPFVFQARHFKVYCLHTKVVFWLSSSKELVRDGLLKLIEWCAANDVESLAIPALGCGKGGLNFKKDVQPIIQELLKDSPIDIVVYCE